MDDKTFEYMKTRIDKEERLKREICDLHYKCTLAKAISTRVCPRNNSLSYYDANIPFPDEARAAVVAAIDAQIKELEDKLAEL